MGGEQAWERVWGEVRDDGGSESGVKGTWK